MCSSYIPSTYTLNVYASLYRKYKFNTIPVTDVCPVQHQKVLLLISFSLPTSSAQAPRVKDPYKYLVYIKTKTDQIPLPTKVNLLSILFSWSWFLSELRVLLSWLFHKSHPVTDFVPTLQCTDCCFLLFDAASNPLQFAPTKDYLHELPCFLLILDPKVFWSRIFFYSLSWINSSTPKKYSVPSYLDLNSHMKTMSAHLNMRL